MSLLLAIAFATTGAAAATQGGDIPTAIGYGVIQANSSTTQGADSNNGIAQAYQPAAASSTTQGGDTGTGRGIPSLGPLGIGFSPIEGAQVETWTPVTEDSVIWNLGG